MVYRSLLQGSGDTFLQCQLKRQTTISCVLKRNSVDRRSFCIVGPMTFISFKDTLEEDRAQPSKPTRNLVIIFEYSMMGKKKVRRAFIAMFYYRHVSV